MTPAQTQSRRLSLDQERAKIAWEKVADVKANGKNAKGQSYADKYGSLARSAPADILSFGLGQTLAFWRARGYENGHMKDGGNEHAHLLKDVDQWVSSQLSKQPAIAQNMQNLELLKWITDKASTSQYRLATTEAIAFLTWLKRFAEAELG